MTTDQQTSIDRTCQDRPASAAAFERACRVLVGGVNSPVRAFGSVGGTPVTVAKACGAYVEDIDGHRYIDLVGTWGPAIVGHAHPEVLDAVNQAVQRGLSFGAPCEDETRLAELILSALPGHERLRFVNSGTEACMSALRLARAATGRQLVIKFAGNYHGHSDSMLVAAGSGAATHGVPTSPGVSDATANGTIVVGYNDADEVATVFKKMGSEIAAIIVEPVAGNMGLIKPAPGFLERLRELCDSSGALLIFDEVMTGFRVAWGGYQVTCGIQPDLTCLGKVVGGGMPVAAYAGPARLLDQVSPIGPVYQAGTLSGNPIGMAAGLATLELCQADRFYERLARLTSRLAAGLAASADEVGISMTTGSLGGMVGFSFTGKPVQNFADAQAADHALFGRFFHAMLDRGVWLPPSGYEACFVSAAHDEAGIDTVVAAAAAALREVA
jgi:glutamate-1-semialdehyde 2,1-aminomutase